MLDVGSTLGPQLTLTLLFACCVFAGALFVTIPMMQFGGHAMTESWQKAVNKGAGIK